MKFPRNFYTNTVNSYAPKQAMNLKYYVRLVWKTTNIDADTNLFWKKILLFRLNGPFVSLAI